MTFLNGLLLFGTAAAAVPLLIHLLHRSKFRVVDWGAMHLLESIIQDNQRRIRFRELLLLLVRCAVPVLLALCMARPLLESAWWGAGSTARELWIAVDHTASMGRSDTAGQSHWDRADKFLAAATAAQRADAVRWYALGGGVRPLPPPTLADRPLTDWQPDTAGLVPPRDLPSLFEAIAQSSGGPHHLLVVSDFQTEEWGDLTAETLDVLRAARGNLPWPPRVTLVSTQQLPRSASAEDASVPAAAAANIAVEQIEVSPRRARPGQTVVVTALARLQGSEPIESAEFSCWYRQQPVASETIALPAGSVARLRFAFPLPAAAAGSDADSQATSWWPIEIRSQTEDALPADNRAVTLLRIAPPVRVAVVGFTDRPTPSNAESLDATDFVMTALSPFAFTGEAASEALPETVSAARLAPGELLAENLADVEVLVLCDLPRLSETQRVAITDFVAHGGGLLIFSGPRSVADRDWINRTLWRAGEGWFPVRLGAAAAAARPSRPTAETDPIDTGQPIAGGRYEHPALRLFNRADAAPLSEAICRGWVRLAPTDGTAEAPRKPPDRGASFSPLIALQNGDPLWVEGAPRVLWCATSADPSWTNLPLRPAYVPLLQSLVQYAAGGAEPPIAAAGAGLRLQMPTPTDGAQIRVVGPDGQPRAAELAAAHATTAVHVADNHQVGIYEARGIGDALLSTALTPLPATESSASYLGGVALHRLAEALGAETADSPQGFASQLRRGSLGREIWRALWWAVLCLLILERALVWWLGRIG